MNKTYRLIWNELTHSWLAVAEIAKARGKRTSRALLLVGIGSVMLPAPTFAQAPPAATELPTGGQVVAGQAGIAQTGATMNITQSTARAAIDWQSFNVGSGATVNFIQPSSSAVILNRVLSGNASQIFGQINANGQVFLSNPNGVYFAPGASVNVGGLVATTHSIGNDDFMAGNYRFTRNGATGSVINDGNLSADLNGYIALLAPEVRNNGIVIARMGTVALAAGEAYELQFAGNNTLAGLQVEPATLAALVENGNAVQAPSGLVILSARATDQLQGGVIRNSGAIEATGLVEKGGRIVLEGDHITLANGSLLDASGATGGGEVLVGGGWQGSGATYQATTVTMEQGATIDVSATRVGNGGTAVLWSDVTNASSQTRAYGTIWAKGGGEGGDGGRIETSGHWLDTAGVRGSAAAPNGKAGEWLFDPYNVTITSANLNGSFSSGTWTPSGNSSTILNTDINALLEGGTSVTVTTGSTGSEIGDITVASAITKASGNSDVTLTMRAANSIVVDAAISNTGGTGKLHVTLDADNNNGSRDGAGIILLNNDISTGGGDINFGSGATLTINGLVTKVGGDVYVAGTGARSLTTGGGNVAVNGEMIIANTNGLTISTSNGNVTFGGIVNSGNTYTGVNYSGTWSQALSNAASGSGSGTGDTYLATITSRLENAIASRAVSYNPSWLGGRRVAGVGTNSQWRWVTGPEASQDTNGLIFFTQSSSGGGTTVSGLYSNWSGGEPNNWGGGTDLTREYESVLQFTGSLGQWNDLTGGPNYYSNTPQSLSYYVKETNLAASPVTVNAGTGTVTFSGAAGSSKALASLNVTANTIAINGGAVTTEGAQTYAGNVTLGASSTTLTQTNADTHFAVQAGKAITNASGGNASLAIVTTGIIELGSGSSISSSTGALNLTLNADSDATNGGSVWVPEGASISTNGGNIKIGGGANADSNAQGFNLASGESNARYRGVTINGTVDANGGNIAIKGQARTNASARGRGVSIGGALSTNGNGTITIVGVALGISDGVAIGDTSITGPNGSVTAVNGNISITGTKDTGSNGINISTSGSSISTTGTGALIMNATGNINGTGTVAIGGTTSLTAGAANITLTNSSNNFGGAVSIASAGNASLVDSNAMTLGAVTATGTLDIATLTGDLTLTGAVATTDATANAVKLNAGKNAAAGTAAGGNIIVSGGSVSTGAGGIASIYSGSVSGSTGLTNLIGSGSGRFRYNSDESASNFTTALTAGTHAIYREQPTVTVTANNQSKTYDGLAYSGGNGASHGGFVNGDTSAGLGGTLAYGGTSQGAVNAASYVITPSGLTTGLGYALAFVDGTLTISPAALTVTASNVSKTYGQTISFAGTEFISSGLQNGETIGSVTLASNGALATAGAAGSPYAITAANATGGSFNAGNYTITYVNGTLTISPAALTVTANNASKTYGQTTSFAGTEFTSSGLQNGETIGSVTLASNGAPATAGVAGSPYAITAANATGGSFSAGNYSITYVDGALTIEAASPPPPPPTTPTAPLPTPETSPTVLVISTPPVLDSGPTILPPSVLTATTSGISVKLVQEPSVQQIGNISVLVPKEMTATGASFSFPLPAQAMADAAPDAPVQARLANGDPLPTWLRFISETRTFIATNVPAGALPIQVVTVGGLSSMVIISERTD